MARRKAFVQDRPLVDQLPAAERAAIIEADILQALEDGRFRFVFGYLQELPITAENKCRYGGCAIAALAYCVAGYAQDGVGRAQLSEASEDTGLVTADEARSLEAGYEGFDLDPALGRSSKEFYAAGKRLRKEADRRGTVEIVRDGDYRAIGLAPVRW